MCARRVGGEEYRACRESSSDWRRLTSLLSGSSFAAPGAGVLMPTIRDLVGAIRRRDGVDAAVVLGRDGLLIDSETASDVDAESVAALVPSIVAAADCTLVVTNATLAPAVRELLPELPAGNVIAEPKSAGTAPALAWAAVDVERRGGAGAVMLCVHADWAIGDPDGFRATLWRAAEVAERQSSLVTVGVVPSRPDPGYGYIQPAEPAGEARRVARFVEKPDRAT